MFGPFRQIIFRGFDALALVGIEDRIVAKDRKSLLSVFGAFVFLFVNLPEDNRGALFAFAHVSAHVLSLLEGHPERRGVGRTGKQEGIYALIVLLADEIARAAIDAIIPRLTPRGDAVFQHLDDAVSDDLIHVRLFVSSHVKSSLTC